MSARISLKGAIWWVVCMLGFVVGVPYSVRAWFAHPMAAAELAQLDPEVKIWLAVHNDAHTPITRDDVYSAKESIKAARATLAIDKVNMAIRAEQAKAIGQAYEPDAIRKTQHVELEKLLAE